MLEILYDTATKEVRALNGDDKVQGNLKPKSGQEVVVWDISIPNFASGEYRVDVLNKGVVDGDPDFVPSPLSRDLAAEMDELKAKVEKLEIRKS